MARHSKEVLAGKTTSNRKLRRLALQESDLSMKPKPRRLAEIERSDVEEESGYSTNDTYSHSGDEDLDDGETSVSSLGGSVGRVLEPEETPVEGLNSCIAAIQDFKKTKSAKSMVERARVLNKYLHIVRADYFGYEISAAFNMIRDALLRLISTSGNDEEQLLALRCLAVSLLSCSTAEGYLELKGPLRRLCVMETTVPTVKRMALLVLGVAVIYAHGTEEDCMDLLEFLVDIIETDGSSVEATDSADVVFTALHVWAFVAAHHDDLDLEDISIRAMEAFTEQLESTDVEVLASTSFNIAFVFEASRRAAEQHGKGYNIRQDPRELIRDMKAITQQSKSIVGRKNGREVVSRLSDAIAALEHGYGPNYSTAGRPLQNPHVGVGKAKFLDPRDFREFGYRDKLLDKDGNTVLTISTWAQSAQVRVLRSLLLKDSNIAQHLEGNPDMRSNVFPSDEEEEDSDSSEG